MPRHYRAPPITCAAMRHRIAMTGLAATLLSLALSAPALAAGFGKGSGAGEGALGETNDKIVTFFCLGVLLFFVLTIIVGTLIQKALENRKDAHKAAKMRQRVGW
jgi:nitrogen fixation/metabolism regulation signal transduction histidine kinase